MVIPLNSLLAFPFLWHHMLEIPYILSDKIPLERTLFQVDDFNRMSNAITSKSYSSYNRVTFMMCVSMYGKLCQVHS